MITKEQARAELQKRGIDWKTGKKIQVPQQPPDWKGVIGNALKEASFGKGTMSRGLMAPPPIGNPEMQAQALPYLASTAMAGQLPFGGGTIAMGGGQALRDLSLKAQGKSIPSVGQHASELGGVALGDIMSGLGQKAFYGMKIGEAEKVGGLGNVEKMAPASNPRTGIKLVQQINQMESMTPEQAKSIQPAFRTIWKSGWVWSDPYKEYLPDVVKASQKVQAALNQIPGRGEASKELARVMTMHNKLGALPAWIWRNAPKLAARGARWGIIGVP